MTREQVKELLMTIQAVFPNYKPQDKTIAVNAWYAFLADYDVQQVQLALKAYITSDTSGFAPSIGQLIAKIQAVTQPKELNELEAWSMVSKALRNGTYGAQQEFDKLPELVQKAVGNPENLRNWAQSDNESVETVIQSNFIKTYRTEVKRAEEIARMPENVRAKIANASESVYLPHRAIENQKPRELSQKDLKSKIGGNTNVTEGIPMPDRFKDAIKELKNG